MRKPLKPVLRPAALLLGLTLILAPSLTQAKPPLAVGDPAPDFSVQTLDGKTLQLSELIGKKPVYLKFWATWCSYCKAEMPYLQSVYEQPGEPVQVLSVNVGINDSVANIQQLFKAGGYSMPTTFDQNGALTAAYGVVGTPTHILIDRDGRVAYRTFLLTDQLENIVADWSQQEDKQ